MSMLAGGAQLERDAPSWSSRDPNWADLVIPWTERAGFAPGGRATMVRPGAPGGGVVLARFPCILTIGYHT
jgi:hypothetical protein